MADNTNEEDKIGGTIHPAPQVVSEGKAEALPSSVVTSPILTIEQCIYNIRGQQIMLDYDLARLYQVETKQLNRQVKRNIERFPSDFMFQLTQEEINHLRCHFGTSSWGGSRYLPYAFSENGVAMLSGILRSETAIKANILIMRAFTAMRRFMTTNAQIFERLETIEHHQLSLQVSIEKHDKEIAEVLDRLQQKEKEPQQGIFYDGQIFDAYTFVAGLIKSATREILLIDNYIDETVLTLLDKRSVGVDVKIYTAQFSRQLQLDLAKHNAQFAPIAINVYKQAHDRFLCIDDTVYHIGASIKDLGRKWFAFAKMYDLTPADLVKRINGIV